MAEMGGPAGVLDADVVTLAAWLTIGTIDVCGRAGHELTVGAQLVMMLTWVEYTVATCALAEAVQTGAAPLQEVMVL